MSGLTVILVCGGRNYYDREHVWAVLDQMRAHYGDLVIVHGGATGADNLADHWAVSRHLHAMCCRALWGVFGKGAGVKRNTAMAALAPALSACIGFPGGEGTANMMEQADAAGVPTYGV